MIKNKKAPLTPIKGSHFCPNQVGQLKGIFCPEPGQAAMPDNTQRCDNVVFGERKLNIATMLTTDVILQRRDSICHKGAITL